MTAAKHGPQVPNGAAPAKDRLVRMLGLPGQKITYEQARDLLDHPDPDVRASLAARDDVEPEILFFLTRDPDPAVRRAVAINAATPAKANLLLAADNDADVRCDLADRVGRLVPGLTDDQQDKAWRTVHQVLILLARDQLPRVRRALSEALKALPNAPHDIVFTLALDPEAAVAAPVLEFSPVLTDEDLKEVIRTSPLTAQLVAISRRINVGEEVSHAIVGAGNVDAITSLLKNPNAQIREETLDAIIDAAPRQMTWHEPLVHRRQLNTKAALRIAEFVAQSLIQALADRTDLDRETTATLGRMVTDKLRRDDEKGGLAQDNPDDQLTSQALAVVSRQLDALATSGRLTSKYVLQAASDGAVAVVVAAIARKANLPVEAVAEVVRAGSAKGMLAAAWAADFTAEEAAHLQLKIARVPPEQVIKSRPGGGFDATEAELEWQLEMFREVAKAKGR